MSWAIGSPSINPETADIIIYKDGDYAVAVETRTRQIIGRDTDHALVIQSAINKLSTENKWGMIYITPSEYNISRTIEIMNNGIVLASGGINQGQGASAKLKASNSVDPLIKIGDSSKLVVGSGLVGLQILGENLGENGVVMYTNKGFIKGCMIGWFKTWGAQLRYASGGEDNIIEDSVFNNNGYGGLLIRTGVRYSKGIVCAENMNINLQIDTTDAYLGGIQLSHVHVWGGLESAFGIVIITTSNAKMGSILLHNVVSTSHKQSGLWIKANYKDIEDIQIYGLLLDSNAQSTWEYINLNAENGGKIRSVKIYGLYARNSNGSGTNTLINYYMPSGYPDMVLIDGAWIEDLNLGSLPPNTILKRVWFKGLLSENSGTATFSGDGTTTQFTIAHGLMKAPSKVIVVPASADASGDFYVTADATNIYVNYKSAPPAGTANVVLYWWAEV